jgi:hypothetical protein
MERSGLARAGRSSDHVNEPMEDAREFSACLVPLAAVMSASLFRFRSVMYEGRLKA